MIEISESRGFAGHVADKIRRGFCPDFAVRFATAMGSARFLKLAADFYDGTIPEGMPPNIRAFFSAELSDHKQTMAALNTMALNSMPDDVRRQFLEMKDAN
jgi:hypothetical protein